MTQNNSKSTNELFTSAPLTRCVICRSFWQYSPSVYKIQTDIYKLQIKTLDKDLL